MLVNVGLLHSAWGVSRRLHPWEPGAEGQGRGLRHCQPSSCTSTACEVSPIHTRTHTHTHTHTLIFHLGHTLPQEHSSASSLTRFINNVYSQRYRFPASSSRSE